MYYYDAAGQLVGFIVNGSTYYYVRNVQGDIIKILDGNMEEVVEYKYDTWGNVIGMEGSAYGQWVGSLNPFRYRGYYYDDETGMYYLTTRYYNPGWCRFLNPDSTLIGNVGVHLHNIFAYASNNPVVHSDPNGTESYYYSPGCLTIYDAEAGISVNVNTKTGAVTKYTQPKVKKSSSKSSGSVFSWPFGYEVSAYHDTVNPNFSLNLLFVKIEMGTKTRIDYTAKSTKPCVTSFNFKTGDVIMKTKSNFRGKMITSSVGASNYGMLKGYSLTDGDITKSFSSTMNLLGATFSGSISQDLGNNVSNITYSDVKIELLPTELIPVAIAIVTFAATGDVSTSQRVFDYAFS